MLQHLEKGDPTIFVYFPAVHDTAVGAAHTVTAAALRLGVVINAYRVEATTAHFHTLIRALLRCLIASGCNEQSAYERDTGYPRGGVMLLGQCFDKRGGW